jgi:hypothetical protein
MSGFLAANDPLDSGGVPNGGLKIKPTPPIITSEPATPATLDFPGKMARTRPHSPVNPPVKQDAGISMQLAQPQNMSPPVETVNDDDPFDVRETVNMLTLQFLSDHPETRIAALEWLLMLHLKAPTKVGTNPICIADLPDPLARQRHLPCAAQDAIGPLRGRRQARLAAARANLVLVRGLVLPQLHGQCARALQH